jgi:hypothetical protein
MKKQRKQKKFRTLKTKKKHNKSKKSKSNKWWHDEYKKNEIKLILCLVLIVGYFYVYRPLRKQYYWIDIPPIKSKAVILDVESKRYGNKLRSYIDISYTYNAKNHKGVIGIPIKEAPIYRSMIGDTVDIEISSRDYSRIRLSQIDC